MPEGADLGRPNAVNAKSRSDHYDFLLETDAGVLLAWRIPCFPPIFELPFLGTPRITAERIPNHREVYLSYEGPLSDHRGSVVRVLFGTYISRVTDQDTLGNSAQHPSVQDLIGLQIHPALKPLSLPMFDNLSATTGLSTTTEAARLTILLTSFNDSWLVELEITPVDTPCEMSIMPNRAGGAMHARG